MAIRYFFEGGKIECLQLYKYMLRLAVVVPDHKLAIALFKHQGILHRFYNNVDGSVSAFQKMRDAAEDIGDFNQEIEAYYQAGLTLKRCR